jgi:hypothetical protein
MVVQVADLVEVLMVVPMEDREEKDLEEVVLEEVDLEGVHVHPVRDLESRWSRHVGWSRRSGWWSVWVTVWVVATRSERWTVIAMAIGMSIAMVALVGIVGVVGIATASRSNVGSMERVGT